MSTCGWLLAQLWTGRPSQLPKAQPWAVAAMPLGNKLTAVKCKPHLSKQKHHGVNKKPGGGGAFRRMDRVRGTSLGSIAQGPNGKKTEASMDAPTHCIVALCSLLTEAEAITSVYRNPDLLKSYKKNAERCSSLGAGT